jgi:hypothetical protein
MDNRDRLERVNQRETPMKVRSLSMTAILGVALMAFGCQPDQRPGDWRVDAGTDVEEDSGSPPMSWDGEWEQLPSPRGGTAAQKVDGQLLMWTRSDGSEYQYEFSHFTTNGTDWKPASESPLASKFEGLEDGWYVEFAEARYLLVTNRRGGRGLNRRVHFSLDGQDDWYEETRLGAITAPNSAYTVQERVVAARRMDLGRTSRPAESFGTILSSRSPGL